MKTVEKKPKDSFRRDCEKEGYHKSFASTWEHTWERMDWSLSHSVRFLRFTRENSSVVYRRLVCFSLVSDLTRWVRYNFH